MIVACLNQKGGVGKTTTTHNLAGTLGQGGLRVLAVDADPQASLTQGLLGPASTRALRSSLTITAILDGSDPDPASLLQNSALTGVRLVAGHHTAKRFNSAEPHRDPRELRLSLRRFLKEIEGDFDLIFIDCPPNLHTASWAALAASDSVLIPLMAEDYGCQGLIDVHESISAVAASDNPHLTILGYLITLFQSRRILHKSMEATLRSLYADLVFQTTIPNLNAFPAAVAHRTHVSQLREGGQAALLMQDLAEELVARVGLVVRRGVA